MKLVLLCQFPFKESRPDARISRSPEKIHALGIKIAYKYDCIYRNNIDTVYIK